MRNIRLGKWLVINNQEEFDKILNLGDEKIGKFTEPGYYLFLNWKGCSDQRAQWNSPYHDIYELIPRIIALKQLEDEVDSIHKLKRELRE